MPVMAPVPAVTSTATAAEPPSPTSAAGELGKLVPANGQISGLTVVLAAVAVLGGGAAWKFYSQHSKEKHEERMKRLEIEANRPETPDQHPSCKTQAEATSKALADLSSQTAAIKARQDAVDERLASIDKKVTEHSERTLAGPSTSDLDERVAKLEKSSKPSPKRATKK